MNLSWFIVTTLKRSGINLIKDLLDCDEEKLRRIKNLDTDEVEEIMGFFNQVANDEIVVVDTDPIEVFQSQPDEQPKAFYYFDGALYLDVPVRQLPFSDVIVFALAKGGYSYLSHLLFAKESELKAIANLNRSNVKLIMHILEYIALVPVVDAPVFYPGRLSGLVYESLQVEMKFPELDFYLALQNDFQEYLDHNSLEYGLNNCLHDIKLKTILKKSPHIRKVLNDHYHDFIIEHFTDVSTEDLLGITPVLLKDTRYVDDRIAELLAAGLIVETSKGYYGIDIPSFKDAPDDLLSEQEYGILLERTKNKKYKVIAQEFNLSRRQVHDISKEAWWKLYRERILYKEDALEPIYTNFNVGYSVFTTVFGDEQTYYYLRNRYFAKIKMEWIYRNPIEELLNCKWLLVHQRRRLEEYLLKKGTK